MKKYIVSITAMIFLAACNNSGNTGRDDTDTSQKLPRDTMEHSGHTDSTTVPMVAKARAVFSGTQPDTTISGQADFDTLAGGKVKMTLNVKIPKLATKTVAIHIHEHGDCGDKGNASHGHWNPDNKQHGQWGVGEFHSGDIGNVALDRQGQGSITLESNLWTLGGPDRTNILNRALIIHSGVDDYKSQPTGNSGSRIGCAVIQ